MTPAIEQMRVALTEAVEDASPQTNLRFKAMFGGAMAYANGCPFASLWKGGLALKLPPDLQEELLRETDAKRLQYGPGEPFSRHYVVVPPRFSERD
jgi:TfoX/Sxy family transcriptional regulator of competence genes